MKGNKKKDNDDLAATKVVANEVEVKEVVANEVEVKEVEAKETFPKGNYIMKVTSLSWGKDNKNQLYAKQKPLINSDTLGKYASVLKIWLENNWIEKGDY